MNILALDLGTHTGYCLNGPRGDDVQMATYELATKDEVTSLIKDRLDRRFDPRINNLFRIVAGLIERHDIEALVFEDVQFGSQGWKQTQLWASLRTAAQLASRAARRLQTVECVATNVLKKFATGSGSATKEMMMTAASTRHPNIFDGYRLAKNGLYHDEKKLRIDDNAVDAFWLWVWAQNHLAKVAV